MNKRILTQLDLNLAKIRQGIATIERHAALGDPFAKRIIGPLSQEIARLKDVCRFQLEEIISQATDPELSEIAAEALWRLTAFDEPVSDKKH